MSGYPIPYVTTRTSAGERTVDVYSRLLADRIVYLGTGIDDGVANAVIAQLLHQGSAGIGGTAMDIAIQADDLRRTRDTVLACIAEDTGQPVARIEEDSRRDRWFTAQEALEYGFVDAVVTSVRDVLPACSARSD